MTVSRPPRVEFDAVTKRYGERTVVDGLSLSVTGGRIHCLLGPNGAGKTTSIHMLLGLRHPSSGEIRVDGLPLRPGDGSLGRGAMGFLADPPALYDDLTGREFLEFLAELHERPARVEALGPLIDRLRVDEALDRPLRTGSLGVRKKVALLGALVPDPAILVLDEPTGALDPHAARVVKDLLRELRDEGRLVLFSTHVLELAQQLADELSVLHAGRLLFTGTLDALRAKHGRHGDEALEEIFLRLTADAPQASERAGVTTPVSPFAA